ncbi:MAG: hypothetical protein NTZ33_13900 [Bacteroidetes bacterium]|nr:hypothetical protein [Bacteroidota bacterium]
MSKFFKSFMGAAVLSLIIACLFGPVFGAVSLLGGFVPKSAGSLQITLNREIFVGALKDAYVQKATWLDEAEDLSIFVDQNQTLKFGEAGDDPEVYVNKTDDVDSVEPNETPHAVDLDTYDSQNYKIRNINLSTLPYPKIEFYTNKSAVAIRKKEALAAAHSFTPTSAGQLKIIIPTTGDVSNGYRMCTINDIQKLAEQMDVAVFPDDGRNVVLEPTMWWELIKNNDILKAQIQYQQSVGIIKPTLVEWYGIKIHKYSHQVGYNAATNQKAALGTAIGGDVVNTAFAFCKNEVFRASGLFDMTYLPFSQNPKGRAHEFGFQHRFKTGFQRDAQKYSALIYKAPAENI